MKYIDLHTDLVLAQKNIGRNYFGIDTSQQTSLKSLSKHGYSAVFSGLSYDDMKGCTDLMIKASREVDKENNTKVAIISHIEGAEIVTQEKYSLERLPKLGIKSIGLTHSHDNSLSGSSTGEKREGLSVLGRAVVKKALGQGMIIDLAHISVKGFYDVLELIGDKPPLVSHTASYKVYKVDRNITDKQLKEIKKRNGVVGIFFSGKFLSEKDPTLEHVFNHIDHMVNVTGIDHVGLGSDFGGITTCLVKDLESADKIVNLMEYLKTRGYKNEAIEKIAYKNAQRVLSQWRLKL